MGDPACHLWLCPNCDLQVAPDVTVCPDCGTKVERSNTIETDEPP